MAQLEVNVSFSFQGKIQDRIGFFPANFVQRVQQNEKIFRCVRTFIGCKEQGQITLKENQVSKADTPHSRYDWPALHTKYINPDEWNYKVFHLRKDNLTSTLLASLGSKNTKPKRREAHLIVSVHQRKHNFMVAVRSPGLFPGDHCSHVSDYSSLGSVFVPTSVPSLSPGNTLMLLYSKVRCICLHPNYSS